MSHTNHNECLIEIINNLLYSAIQGLRFNGRIGQFGFHGVSTHLLMSETMVYLYTIRLNILQYKMEMESCDINNMKAFQLTDKQLHTCTNVPMVYLLRSKSRHTSKSFSIIFDTILINKLRYCDKNKSFHLILRLLYGDCLFVTKHHLRTIFYGRHFKSQMMQE